MWHTPVAVAAVAVVVLGGCTNVVRPPARVAEPTPVFLLDHGRTSSVVLPRDEGFARYAYGDWDWYALNRTGPFRASGVLGFPTRATVGRRVFHAQATTGSVRAASSIPVEDAWRIPVEAPRAARLERDLDRLFREQAEASVYNGLYDQTFVPHPRPYAMWHNSNHVTAEWLRRLGCEVEMGTWFSDWRVEGAEATGGR